MNVKVKITHNDRQSPPGILADAELHFAGGELDGLKLIGFSILKERGGKGRSVTFPARQYAAGSDRRTFTLLRPIVDASAQDGIRKLVVQAYVESEGASAKA